MPVIFRSLNRWYRSLVMAAVISLSAGITPAQQLSPRHSAAGNTESGNRVAVAAGGYYPVVRLRKLHLVRPDLIPYPIYYAVYC